jgi:predicted TIM-barrel fold metal-dependent hydrolase
VSKNGFRILDSDLHVIEPGDLFTRYLDPKFSDRAPTLEISDVSAIDTWVVDGNPFPYWGRWPEFHQANQRLRDKKEVSAFQVRAFETKFNSKTTLEAMDMEGVDTAVLYRTTGGMLGMAIDGLEPEFALALCRAYNDWIADYCKTDPTRLKGVAMLPLYDVDMAIDEARRAVNELGFVGVTVHCEPVNGRLPYDLEVEPLWTELERLGTSVGFHGTSTAPSTEDITRKYLRHPAGRTLTHALSFPTQMMAMIAGLTLSGVLERHPSLRVAFLEANCSWLPWLLYRLDDQWAKYTDAPLQQRPSDYFLRQCCISVEADEPGLQEVINRVGDDNLVISTDYPHPDSAFPHSMDEFFEQEISDDSRRKVLWDNTARLYGITS